MTQALLAPPEWPEASRLVCSTGASMKLPLDAWLGAPTTEDLALLAHAVAPVLDVGCGPGRHVAALATRGVMAVGIDVAPGTVRLARSQGITVLRRSVFDHLPGAGKWSTALLLDGNIGIGGDPVALLCRLKDLVRPGGVVLCEVEPPGASGRRMYARLEQGDSATDWFPWASIGADGVLELATAAGFGLAQLWGEGGCRWFAKLVKQ